MLARILRVRTMLMMFNSDKGSARGKSRRRWNRSDALFSASICAAISQPYLIFHSDRYFQMFNILTGGETFQFLACSLSSVAIKVDNLDLAEQ